jgi:tol-pal system protein YbgF
MNTPLANLIFKILPVTATFGILAACAPPPMTSISSNQTLDMRRVQSSLDRQEQSVQDLTRQVAAMESRLQRQAEEIEQLRQTSTMSQAGSRPGHERALTGEVTSTLPGVGSPTEVYLQAFGDYASGRYQAAIRGFETFQQRFPNNSYASNAQFWLGDCYFNQQQYAQAITEFEKVLNDYPNAPKNPDALLKIAIANLQLGATAEARQAVDTLNRRYPQSAAAQKAQELTIP